MKIRKLNSFPTRPGKLNGVCAFAFFYVNKLLQSNELCRSAFGYNNLRKRYVQLPIPPQYRRSGIWLQESCNRCKYLDHSGAFVKFTCVKYFAVIDNTSICDSFEDSWNEDSDERLKVSSEQNKPEFREKLKQLEKEGKMIDLQGQADLRPEIFEPYEHK